MRNPMKTAIHTKSSEVTSSRRRTTLLIVLLSLSMLLLPACSSGKKEEAAKAEVVTPKEEHQEGEEVTLTPATLQAAKLEFAVVEERAATGSLRVTGSVEANQQQMQQATPLVSGRVERVAVALGDRVRAGQPLATISSPQIAQMHGKLHEAETKLTLAERNLKRVEQTENRVAILSAKAKLDEAEATLKRTRRLIELGAGAGKDLVAAEAAYRTAKAEYEFQSNIALNKEMQEARANVDTARVDMAHIRDEMRSLGAPVAQDEREEANDRKGDISLLALRAPISGTVIERLVNAGAGIESGKPLFTIANLSTVWVIANVPEAMVNQLRIGTRAQVFSTAFAGDARAGRVTYIDPQLNEDTRVAKVRVELANPAERLKTGMFVEIEFQTPNAATANANATELVVPEAAMQRVGERHLVFVADEKEPGHFQARTVEVGGESNGYRRITGGLKAGERVVTQGSFTLKAQMLKGEMGEGH